MGGFNITSSFTRQCKFDFSGTARSFQSKTSRSVILELDDHIMFHSYVKQRTPFFEGVEREKLRNLSVAVALP